MRIYFQTKYFLFKENLQIARRYYHKWQFALLDLSLFSLYLFSNPYRMSRKFLQKRGEFTIHTYGETPLTELEKIAKAFEIAPSDRFLDLGSGRGRGCFWISAYWGCQARGVDWIPGFVSRASWLVQRFSKIAFHNISIEKADFSWPTVVFFCGTCIADDQIEKLLTSMETLQKGSKVITLSEPLNHPSYQLIQSIPVTYPWGETDAYLQLKIR